jgi:hypothetical protein
MIPELQPTSSVIRISPEIDVPITSRVRRLIDTAAFRRLSGITQLGLDSLVYPGASHFIALTQQADAEACLGAHGGSHHVQVALFEDLQWQTPFGKQHRLQRKQGQHAPLSVFGEGCLLRRNSNISIHVHDSCLPEVPSLWRTVSACSNF